ncbi:pseudooxynicotine oxidase [bacterium BMS3Abin07]|nr:pseudooxynicotine oxidase [bacterium BMS3Abin07]HDO21311.1 FAD-binding protein [Nitrospirota bacterium]HDZ87789.1 FAD-binding protein [Nitrospirota bacterium]
MNMYDIIIIGAGISGLSLSHYCTKEGLKTLVIEKSNRVGGTFHSHRFEGEAPDFWIEAGAHTCYNSYRNLIGIIEDCGIRDRMIPMEKVPFRMLVDNQIKSIPSQINFMELLYSAPGIFTLKKQGESVESYYSRIVGKHNFERVFSHIFNAVASQRTNDFPADILFKKRIRRKDILKKYTFRDGLQTITDSIASQQGIEVQTGKEVKSIQSIDNQYEIETGDGSRYLSSSLALANPVSVAAELLQSPFPDISQQLSRIKMAKVESVGVAVKKEMVSLEPFAGIIPLKDSFFSIVSRDTVIDEHYRGFTFHFRPDIMDMELKLKRIGEVLGVQRDQLNHVIAKENSVPSPKIGHGRLINTLDSLIADKSILLTGNYFSGVSIEDCVSRSLSEFNRLKKLLSNR